MKYSNKRDLVSLLRMLRLAKENWLLIITIHIIIFAFFIYYSNSLSEAANIGDFLAGFAGSLAFLWFIASFRQQGKELSLQRHELELQRRALELQTHELKSMAEYAALEQVNHIVSGALKKLKEGPEATNDPSKLHFGILGPNSSSHVQKILTSTDPQIVIKTYTEYGTINTPILNFVFSITNAAKLYLKSTGNLHLDYSLNSYEFLLKYQSKVESIPHISEFYGAVAPIILTMNILKPQEKSINLAAYIAVFKSTSRTKSKNLQEDQHYNEGIEYHKRNKIDLPAIASI